MEGACENGGSKIPIKKSEPIMVLPNSSAAHDGLYFLSNLDQNVASIIRTVYCFSPARSDDTEQVGEVIREALANVLVHFYPFAGSLAISSDGKLIVKCTNRGVPFIEAAADCSINELGNITVPNPEELGDLVYTIREAKNLLDMPLLTAQVTKFKGGGFVLGVTVNHCMADGISAMEFINSWAETARGISITLPPFLDRSILKSRQPSKINYPHEEFMEIKDTSNMADLYMQEPLQYKSFHFNTIKLAKLKTLAMENGAVNRCTSFTVLTAFVWRARTIALKMRPQQQTKLLFAVDGRSKLNPPMPKGYFGNGIVLTCCLCTAGELIEKPFSFAVGLVQNAIGIVNDDFVRSAIDYIEVTRAKPSLTATLLVTSWTRLSFGTTDFGWGQPVQFGCVSPPEKEVVLFFPEKNGTELLLGLPTTPMETFQELIMKV